MGPSVNPRPKPGRGRPCPHALRKTVATHGEDGIIRTADKDFPCKIPRKSTDCCIQSEYEASALIQPSEGLAKHDALPAEVIPEKESSSLPHGPARTACLKRRWRSTNCWAKDPAVAWRFRFSLPRCSTPRLGSSAGFDSEGKCP